MCWIIEQCLNPRFWRWHQWHLHQQVTYEVNSSGQHYECLRSFHDTKRKATASVLSASTWFVISLRGFTGESSPLSSLNKNVTWLNLKAKLRVLQTLCVWMKRLRLMLTDFVLHFTVVIQWCCLPHSYWLLSDLQLHPHRNTWTPPDWLRQQQQQHHHGLIGR